MQRRYGLDPKGRVSAAMVIERARAWRLLGTIPLPGSGELATLVAGVVGGCGYFGCPRPGHLHNGLDFLAPTGRPIHAADDGTVALVEGIGESDGYGNFVCLQHRPHLATCYAHLSAVAAQVRVGARVRRGETIGLVGTTGSSTAAHLHPPSGAPAEQAPAAPSQAGPPAAPPPAIRPPGPLPRGSRRAERGVQRRRPRAVAVAVLVRRSRPVTVIDTLTLRCVRRYELP